MESDAKPFEMWWPGTELNPRRQPFQGCALPPELPGHVGSRPRRIEVLSRGHARNSAGVDGKHPQETGTWESLLIINNLHWLSKLASVSVSSCGTVPAPC